MLDGAGRDRALPGREETKGRLIQSLKSFLGSRGLVNTNVLGRTRSIEDLIARILADLRSEASRQFGVDIREATVGRPVKFVGATDDEDDAYAESRLAEAFKAAGFDRVAFELEPVAAAHQYESKWRMPLVFYAEGGGGRPGDTDRLGMTGLDGPSFVQFAKLSGLVPVIGVVSGYCFAGNAAMLGCCDVIIATMNASIGMGGPAMIEGGGLGVYHPAEVGPVSFQSPNGVIDILVEDEAEATAAAQKYLSYFQGAVADWKAPDQRLLRRAIPENRLRVYDIRNVIDLLADEGSVLEIRQDFGVGMITAFIRIEGKPFGLIANNPKHLGGAIDAPAGDKAARFMQLCDAFDIPLLSLCDTPGFMVGPEAEKTAIVRHVARMFVTGASLTVPLFGIVLRKGYGLGAQSMIGGGFHASFFTVAWPTGEFGGMGLEGYVRLGFRKEMEAIEDPDEREEYYQAKVAELYANGKAVSIASVLEIDEVIDPADTRQWIMAGLRSVPKPEARTTRKRPCIDAW